MSKQDFGLHDYFPFRLDVASERIRQLVSAAYTEDYGVSIAEWRIMMGLFGGVQITQHRLSELVSLHKVPISRAVMSLCKRRLISREMNPFDGRSHFLRLTLEGRELVEKMVVRARELEIEIFSRFEDSEKALLIDLVERMGESCSRSRKLLTRYEAEAPLLGAPN